MPSILITPPEEDEDHFEDLPVMVFTETATAEQVAAYYRHRQQAYGDCYEVPEADRQFHLYDPLWLTPEQEQRILALQPEPIPA